MKPSVGVGVLWCVGIFSSLGLVWLAGCAGLQPAPPEEARLAGDWTTTDENGDPAAVRFDDQGQLQGIVTRNDSGDVIVIVINQSTTTVDGNDVTIEISTPAGSAVFTGVLSADDNTLTGSLTQSIEVSDEITVVIPEGERVLSRVTDSACLLIECPEGESCVDGQCVAGDPCASVICTNGEDCVDGQCMTSDPCADVVCSNGEECVEGQCVTQDPCADVVCTNGEVCVDGVCELDQADGGDAVSGQAFYESNGCAGCHGADASGGIGPSLGGVTAASILENLNGADSHPVTVDGVTQADAENVAAFVTSVQSG